MSINPRRRSIPFIASLCAAFLAAPASAIDGVIGINQVQALAGGVTAGDGPGFPVTLSTSGSYILTSNLTVGDLNTTAILITAASGVTLDLNGFTIKGACPTPAGCAAGAGASLGVDARVSSGTMIRNGRVRGFGSHGIATGGGARVRSTFVEGNGGTGISVEDGSEVSDSRAFDNAGTGISASGSTVSFCTAESNFDGMLIGAQSLVVHSSSIANARNGIFVYGNGTTVRRSVASLNAADGIVVAARGGLVVETVTYGNAAGGISMGASGSVQRNISVSNAIGLYLIPDLGGNPAAYRGNVVGNTTVNSVSGGINMGENSCNRTLTCPWPP